MHPNQTPPERPINTQNYVSPSKRMRAKPPMRINGKPIDVPGKATNERVVSLLKDNPGGFF
ncbi:MAG: hypothetical protein A2743_01555 [Candidatus Taylorbacteria bacterium RIFCSPHIGHO2_01_FULL_43_47]|nr:MAG: hypothetical protein A2743_01555 [Candidatus Taylorbacteria bacterium RIFCSPHIGHO2_01_FULL_43_47]